MHPSRILFAITACAALGTALVIAHTVSTALNTFLTGVPS